MFWAKKEEEPGKKYKIRCHTPTESGLFRLLLRWKGSVWKLLIWDLLALLVIYNIIAVLYHAREGWLHLIADDSDVQSLRSYFEMICIYMHEITSRLHLGFVIGFLVEKTIEIWWEQYMTLPWPDPIFLKILASVKPLDNTEETKCLKIAKIKRMMRYINLSTILAFRMLTSRVHEKYPDNDTLIRKKLLTKQEGKMLDKVRYVSHTEYIWAPLSWTSRILNDLGQGKKVHLDPYTLEGILKSLERYEASHRKLLQYGWFNFPLAYTQLATLTAVSVTTLSVIGEQFLDPPDTDNSVIRFNHTLFADSEKYATDIPFKNHTPNIYIPFHVVLVMFAFLGWIKLAICLLYPYGDDDVDFNINESIIDRNIQVANMFTIEACNPPKIDEDVTSNDISFSDGEFEGHNP